MVQVQVGTFAELLWACAEKHRRAFLRRPTVAGAAFRQLTASDRRERGNGGERVKSCDDTFPDAAGKRDPYGLMKRRGLQKVHSPAYGLAVVEPRGPMMERM
jgi:hypothetical protein